MTAKMTDEQIDAIRLNEKQIRSVKFVFTNGFRSAESIYLPQIQQLQSEIESLSQSNLSLKQLAKDMAEKSQQLTSKHEKLVKGLRELPVSMIDASPIRMFGNMEEPFIHKPFIDELLTESEGNV